ncbi:uncharacterized protein LOC108209644 isoform X2 [Daucus carota subsp. sativus]|uniref:uncharacterized protein LOC108209644 isoform X2 n=2 Tax=Daucus carota subsp. sativus TaxID=79200 RepID=UPI0007EFC344|nr:PREDICTED: cysteine-rich PDZ-binding protein-like isoform X3 [Daucus carota subsp. sativus]
MRTNCSPRKTGRTSLCPPMNTKYSNFKGGTAVMIWLHVEIHWLAIDHGPNTWTPYGTTKCIICKQQVHQNGKYCHTCAYTKGVCAMCGKQVLDTQLYKQSNV